MFKPRTVKRIPGIGKVFDYRGTGLCPGVKQDGRYVRIKPLIMVEHIPVLPNQKGLGDFLQLGDILRERGLNLQAATDSEGHIALFNDLNVLCWQAKGANQVSCGVEHMHMTVGEEWTRKQLCASAYLWVRAERNHDIPIQGAKIRAGGPGVIRVVRKGHTSHRRVSAAAGFHDRSDPGPGYDWAFVKHAALYYRRKDTFVGV